MKFKTHNDWIGLFIWGCLQWCIDTSYFKLRKIFWKPMISLEAYKTDVEWVILFEDWVSGCIYNYKTWKNYCWKEWLPKSKITEWHIWWDNKQIVTRISILVDNY